ncbi:hypothetical protein ABL78_1423 [Leptomonas seymouri]|uniref:SMP-LTD domain-containing protein n=1 Tax=Leptomonas seymouri TaxID=5684 RepID=A0A0N0P822_LEPSE|nr:hypothetical protein ABL78_1423 [Leptomonas seymouri]|eukprot:KPI89459.1 hypothetical protein ABL78_1423 [Leptomonas seymouri]
MSLHFNWSRLDETCAEALRQLINKRLAEVVERINSKNESAAEAARHSSPSTASLGLSANVSYSKGGLCGSGGAVPGGAAVSTSLVSVASGPGGSGNHNKNPTGAEPPPSGNAHGSPRELYSGLPGMPDPASHSTFLIPSLANSAPGSGGSAVGTAPATITAESGAAVSASPLRQSSSNGGGLSGLRGSSSVSGVCGPANDEGSTYTTRYAMGYGNVNNRACTGDANATAAPNHTNANDFYSPGVGGISRGGAGGTATPAASYAPSSGVNCEIEGGVLTEPRKVPPLVYLEVGSVEWGTTPPFVEIVAFENATDGPPGHDRAPQHRYGAMNSAASLGGPQGEAWDASPYAANLSTSTDTAMTSSTAIGGCFAASMALGTAVAGDAGAENNSEGSHDFTVSHSATGLNTPRTAAVGQQPGVANMAACSTAGTAAHTQAAGSLSQIPCEPDAKDPLASVVGIGGLHIRFHITYGGALHLSLNTAVQHEIRFGAVALRVSLPMMFCLANLDLDCCLCINIKNNVCQVWLEHGPLSSSVVNRLSITATFGGDNELDGDGGDYGASSTDFYSGFGSSNVSDDENGEGGNGAYVNEHEVSQFVLHELRAILKETIVAPHSIEIPISFGG